MEVPSTDSPLEPHELQLIALQTLIDPLAESDELGMDLYTITKQFVEFCIAQR